MPGGGFDLKSAHVGVATVAAIVVAVSGVAYHVSGLEAEAKIRDASIAEEIRTVRRDIAELEQKIEALNASMIGRTSERYRRTDMIIWAHQLARVNPTLKVPFVGPHSPTAPAGAIDIPNIFDDDE